MEIKTTGTNKLKILVIIFSVTTIILCSKLQAQDAPYPPSSVIESVQWELDNRMKYGQGSDQWPMTWAKDGSLYAAWGDGWGWTKGEEQKRSIGITKITSNPPDLQGEDLWGNGPGSSFGKPDALIAIEDTLYMFWTNGDSKYDHDSYTAFSADSGKTWKLGEERLLPYAPAGFRVRGICQFGKGYEGSQNDYLYIYFGLNRHADIYLARVKKQNIFDPYSYQWYVYTNQDGSAFWTFNFSRKSTVFHDGNAYLWHLSICYNKGLERYLLVKPHYSDGDNRETVFAPETKISGFGMFDSLTPWGPWTTVVYEDDFIDELVKFNYIIPTKFISKDGKTFWLAWSGWPEYDNVNFIKGHFKLRTGN